MKWYTFKGRCVVVGLVGLLAVGCQESAGPMRITGEITVDGKPLSAGSISLTALSASGMSDRASGSMVMNGKFEILEEAGLPAGTYRVFVRSTDAGNSSGVGGMPSQEDASWEEEVTIHGESEQELKINLTTQPQVGAP